MFGHYANREWCICQVYDYETKIYPNYIIYLLGIHINFQNMYIMMFLLIKCIRAAEILSSSDAVNVHVTGNGVLSDHNTWGV